MILFKDRLDAGRRLAEETASRPGAGGKGALVLGIPRGGIAVGCPVAERLSCPLEPVSLRKLPVPGNDQMGFGAVGPGREVILNRSLVEEGLVPPDEVERVVDEVYAEVLRRDRRYRGGTPFPGLAGRPVVIVDDGLATGYTMLAAVSFAAKKRAAGITAAVPVAHEEAWSRVKREVDDLICLHVDRGFSFAVASFYGEFPDLTDDEVVGLLAGARRGACAGTRGHE